MKRPQRIEYPDGRVARIVWKRAAQVAGKRVYGATDMNTGQITIDLSSPEGQQARALIHEVLHHALLPLSLDEDQSERLVGIVETLLAGSMFRAPDVWHWAIDALRAERDAKAR